MIQYQRLGDALVQRGLITQARLQKALDVQMQSGLRLGEIMVGMGMVTEDDLTACLAEQYGLDIVDVDSITPEPAALELVSPSFALAHLILPIRVTDEELVCVVVDPLDLTATDATAHHARRKVTFALCSATRTFNAIQKAYKLGQQKTTTDKKTHVAEAGKKNAGKPGRRQEDRAALLLALQSAQDGKQRKVA